MNEQQLEVVHNERSETPWLEWQVGYYVWRSFEVPVYDGTVLVGCVKTNHKVQVFHLKGWGMSKGAAIEMAAMKV